MNKKQHKEKRGLILALGEIFLKSRGVQEQLRKKLIENILFFLKKEKITFELFQFHERIFIATGDIKKTATVLKNTSGLSWFSECFFFDSGLSEISDFIKDNYKNWIKENHSFALRVKRDSIAKESKEEIINDAAKHIDRKVDLDCPKVEIFIERRIKGWFLYFKKQKGQGGYPSGSQGKVITLMSGGIDSPVASYLINKKGVENIWVHFHSFPLVSKSSIEKIKEFSEIFLNYQKHLKIYFIPFQKIQMEIKVKIPAKYRILLYRRMMFKIAEIIAQKEKAQALVTGESLAQVSSQTLANIKIIEEEIKLPIFRPLISLDKEEIISLAKKIKSYQISIKPQEDCCTLFTPKHSSAEGNFKIVKELEKKLEIGKMIDEALKETIIEKF